MQVAGEGRGQEILQEKVLMAKTTRIDLERRAAGNAREVRNALKFAGGKCDPVTMEQLMYSERAIGRARANLMAIGDESGPRTRKVAAVVDRAARDLNKARLSFQRCMRKKW